MANAKVKYIGETDIDIINGNEYEATGTDDLCGNIMYVVIDEEKEEYLYAPGLFEIVDDPDGILK